MNQIVLLIKKAIIESYIKKNEDLEFVDFYIDNGYSGTTFDRPEYKRMFKDIVDGQVNTVIVKDYQDLEETTYNQMII